MKGIKFVSAVEETGYGNAARAYLRGLIRAGVPVTWQPVRWDGRRYSPSSHPTGDAELDPTIGREQDYDVVLLQILPEYYPEWRRREAGKRVVGYTTWETTELKAYWVPLLAEVDLVLVPSVWNAEVFRRSGVRAPIRVIPHIHEEPRASAGSASLPPLAGVDPDRFVFYSIAPWTHRKGPWRALEAYWRAFDGSERVLFVLKTGTMDCRRALPATAGPIGRYLFNTRRTLANLQGSQRSKAPVVLLNQELPEDGMHALHERGDCYVSLCAAEGWGLGAFDAAGRGKPVIMTGFGGQLDFLPSADAFLVDYRLEEVARSGAPELSGSWAMPDVQHAAKHMRYVFDHREEAKERGERLRANVKERFGEAVVIRDLLAALGVDAKSA